MAWPARSDGLPERVAKPCMQRERTICWRYGGASKLRQAVVNVLMNYSAERAAGARKTYGRMYWNMAISYWRKACPCTRLARPQNCGPCGIGELGCSRPIGYGTSLLTVVAPVEGANWCKRLPPLGDRDLVFIGV